MDTKRHRFVLPDYVAIIAILDTVALTLFWLGIFVFWQTPFAYPWAIGWHLMLIGTLLIPHRFTSGAFFGALLLLHVPIVVPWLRII